MCQCSLLGGPHRNKLVSYLLHTNKTKNLFQQCHPRRRGSANVATKQKQKRKRRFWVRSLIQDRQQGSYTVAKELCSDEEKFQSFYKTPLLTFH